MEITCKKCGKTKDVSQFYTAKDYQSYTCIDCSNLYRKNWKRAKRPKSNRTVQLELIIVGQKKCNHCGVIKPLTDFGLCSRIRSGYYGSCKVCRYLMEKSNKMRYAYGLSVAEYQKLLLTQDNSCAICRANFAVVRKICVDHEHGSGQTRGLLCDHCNRGIGLLKENIEVLQNAINYIQAGPFKTPLNGEHPAVGNPVPSLEETPESA